MEKLKSNQRHILKMVAKGQDDTGWAKVSEALYPTLSKMIPANLATFEKLEDGGRAQLTPEGEAVVHSMQYL